MEFSSVETFQTDLFNLAYQILFNLANQMDRIWHYVLMQNFIVGKLNEVWPRRAGNGDGLSPQG